MDIEPGNSYRFSKCFYSNNGWVYARNPNETIEMIHHEIDEPMGLAQIAAHLEELNGKYITTLLYVVSISPKKNIIKADKELSLSTLKCFENGYLVDVTIWNQDIPDLTHKWVLFSGFRVKALSNKTLVLASTVYSNINVPEAVMK